MVHMSFPFAAERREGDPYPQPEDLVFWDGCDHLRKRIGLQCRHEVLLREVGVVEENAKALHPPHLHLHRRRGKL